MELIYHICMKSAWESSADFKEYRTDSLNSEGFIHCSTIHQIPRVLNVFYSDQKNLVLLEIDINLLETPLKWEPGTDKADELFPHIYGSINKDAILRVIDIRKGTVEQLLHSLV